jgi:hypothetical protein
MLSLFVTALLIINAASFGPMGPDTPAREPQMVADGSSVYMTFGAGNAVYFSSSRDSGRTFSPPVRVAENTILPLSRHRGPRIAVTRAALVITAVAGKTLSQGPHAHGLPSDGDLLVWRSSDQGKTWSKPATVNDVPGAPTEGLHSLAADKNGHLFAVWLDKRAGKGTQLYGARSNDGGVSWSKNILVYNSPDGSICECCHPSAAIDSNGQAIVMWRNELAGARDMYLARSTSEGTFSKPENLGQGSWELNACPMDGGGLVIAGKTVVTAWRRNKEIFFASPGEKERPVAEGSDVSLAVSPQGVYAVWNSPAGIMALLPNRNAPVVVAPRGAFPAIVALEDHTALAAWEADGKISVERIP